MLFELLLCIILTIILVIPFRKMKLRYQLLSYDESNDSYFYGNDEMANAYDQYLANRQIDGETETN